MQEASAEFWIVFWENANNSRKKRCEHTSLCQLQVLSSSDLCGCNFHDLHQRDCKDKFKQKHQTSGGFSMGSSSLLNSKLHKFFATGMTGVKQTLQTWTESSRQELRRTVSFTAVSGARRPTNASFPALNAPPPPHLRTHHFFRHQFSRSKDASILNLKQDFNKNVCRGRNQVCNPTLLDQGLAHQARFFQPSKRALAQPLGNDMDLDTTANISWLIKPISSEIHRT